MTPYLTKEVILVLYERASLDCGDDSKDKANTIVIPAKTMTSDASPPQLRVLRADELEGPKAETRPVAQPSPELLAEISEASMQLEKASPQQILQWAVNRFAPKFTMATAFGPEGMCILHMLADLAPETPVFNLDTGYQFAETLELRERVKQKYGIEVELKRPKLSVAEYEAANGGPVYATDPNRCCFDRKIAVLHEAAAGFDAWASAIRRDQSPDRAKAPIVGWDKKFGLVKVSPLANWTKKEVWSLISKEDIPYNPLHDVGFTSIGCQPCTRNVMPGEDERAGRWSGFAKTECGLHTSD
jgi:phosphoadenosine phosphosulfate reductase